MRLKRVRIFGFKTFADRTEFDLDGGIVAVVGPNGCGKSNLVDAILWGLGEGNARHLRAQTTQDVIFSGSANRKAVGFAEVSLLFDNEDGALPIEAPEVTILRRLNRAGEAEYSINRQTCRLRDIYDLLADSGLGRSGYAIVGQKEIDAALSASPEERRGWVDEAAGVQRYRLRKNESLKRLSAANEHLTRVTDIIRELETQREPLRAEAEIAIRYKSLSTSLREVELGMLIRDLNAASREIVELEFRIAESSKVMHGELSRAETLERKSTEIGAKISTLEDELEGLRTRQQGSLTDVERADAEIRVIEQKLQGFDELERSLVDDANTSAIRIAEAETELAVAQSELDQETEALNGLRELLSGADADAKQFSKQIQQLDADLVSARFAMTQKLKAEAELAHRVERRKVAERELKDIDRTLPDLIAGIEEAEKAVAIAKVPLDDAEDKIQFLEQEVARIRREDDDDAKRVRGSMSERSSLAGRKRGIEATIESHEGLTLGSKAVLDAKDRGLLTGNYLPVADAIDAEKEIALAIETALGASANDLIVDDDLAAKRAIEWLKENRAGRATFQPISLMRSYSPTADLSRLKHERGIIGVAAELVGCERRVRPVIDSLLGRILIVESLEDGLRLARSTGWSRMVSLDGEVIHNSGAVTGGRASKQGYGFVQRRADLAEIERELLKLDKLVNEHEKRSAERAKLADQNMVAQQVARESLLGLRDDFSDAADYVVALKDELKSVQKSRAKLEQELASLTENHIAETNTIDIGSIESARDAVLKQLAARSSDAESAEARMREAELRHLQSRARVDNAKRRLGNSKSSDESRQKRAATVVTERQNALAQIEARANDRNAAIAKKAEIDQLLVEYQSRRRELLQQSMGFAEEAKVARENASAISDSLHQSEIMRTRADARRATATQRLMEDYSLSESDALAQAESTDVPDDASSIVNRLRREMRAMGDVNLGAIEAFERVSERFDELSAQRDDVLQGIEQVQSSILELDKLTRDRFNRTFDAVAVAFTELFEKLFGGGDGRLRLTDPSDTLESGVELDITLPGKRRQSLNLLSGGERSLCATAFLFALLQVKPSPLVVLDEVDAPLDGRNVERFASLLNDFVDRSQFIVITHNPATISAAPVWLGVTMQEPGVSTLVRAQLPGEKAATYVASSV